VSRGLGRVQVAVLDYLHTRRGDDHIGGLGEPLFILGPGIHDMRRVAEEMTSRKGLSEPRSQAAFSRAVSRAVRKLVERGRLEPLSIVPVSFDKPNRRYSRFVYELAEGAYFLPPNGTKWSRRFIRLPAARPASLGWRTRPEHGVADGEGCGRAGRAWFRPVGPLAAARAREP
jgi:hypothetical protein